MEKADICEQTQRTILSDELPNTEQERHIKQCKACRELLSQTASLKNDLRELEWPGIGKNEISNAVMDTIKSQKTSAPVPKFRWTHHLGSAAAVAIILAATLILKNPTSPKNANVAFSENEDTPYTLPESQILPSASSTEGETFDDGEKSDIAPFAKTTSDETGGASSSRIATYSGSSQGDDTDFSANDTEEVQNVTYSDSEMSDDGAKSENNSFGFAPVYDDYDEPQALTEASADESAPVENEASGGGSADTRTAHGQVRDDSLEGTSNTESSEAESGENDAYFAEKERSELTGECEDCEETESEQDRVSLFEGIEFLTGEENFDYNISLALRRLSEIYGTDLKIDRQTLEHYGLDTNEKLLKLIAQIEYEDAEKLKQRFAMFLIANG